MNVQTMAEVSAAVGALLFFAAGWLWRRGRWQTLRGDIARQVEDAVRAELGPTLEASDAAARTASQEAAHLRVTLEHERAHTREQIVALQRRLDEAPARRPSDPGVAAALEQARTEITRLREQLDGVRREQATRLSSLQAAEQKLTALTQAQDELRREVALARSERDEARRAGQELQRKAEAARLEASRLHEAVRRHESASGDAEARERVRRQLEDNERTLRARVASLEGEAQLAQERAAVAEARAAQAESELQTQREQTAEASALSERVLDRLADAETRAHRLEIELAAVRIERDEAGRRDATSPTAAAGDPDQERATLRHDLAVQTERARGLEAQALRMSEDNARLQQELATARTLSGELARLRSENEALRARALAGRGAGLRKLTPQLVVRTGTDTRGNLLQSMVEAVTRMRTVESAVVADDLGLVVASAGDHGDELAAAGALFARAGSQVRNVLALRSVHQIVIEDDQNVTVTVRPLRTEVAGESAELTLVVLAVGDSPDPQQISSVVDRMPAPRIPT